MRSIVKINEVSRILFGAPHFRRDQRGKLAHGGKGGFVSVFVSVLRVFIMIILRGVLYEHVKERNVGLLFDSHKG